MTELLLVRHGQTRWNVQGRIQGQLDSPLTAVGSQQAQTLAVLLAARQQTISAIYCSDLGRARQTAHYIAERCGLPFNLDKRLRERHFGALQGRVPELLPEFARQYQQRFDCLSSRLTGGESVAELISRAYYFFAELEASRQSGPVLVVTHGEFIQIIEQCIATRSSCGDSSQPHLPHCQIQSYLLSDLLSALSGSVSARQATG